jgi:hypothetical protein
MLFECKFDQLVRQSGINPNPDIINLDHLPGIGEFPLRVVMERNLHRRTKFTHTSHRASVRTVSGDQFPCIQFDIGKKPLVSFDQDAGMEWGVGVEQGRVGKRERLG